MAKVETMFTLRRTYGTQLNALSFQILNCPNFRLKVFHVRWCEEVLLPRDHHHHNTYMSLDNLVKLQ